MKYKSIITSLSIIIIILGGTIFFSENRIWPTIYHLIYGDKVEISDIVVNLPSGWWVKDKNEKNLYLLRSVYRKDLVVASIGFKNYDISINNVNVIAENFCNEKNGKLCTININGTITSNNYSCYLEDNEYIFFSFELKINIVIILGEIKAEENSIFIYSQLLKSLSYKE